MEQNYKKLFKYLLSIEPKAGLENRIIEKIEESEKARARTRMWAFGTGSLATLGLVLTIGTYLHSSFIESGFYQYFSLLFSGDLSFSFWKEIALSILESTPLLGVIALIGAFTVFVWSTTNTLKPTFNT